MEIKRVGAKFRCGTCGEIFVLEQDDTFLKYLTKGVKVPMRCSQCRADRRSEFLGEVDLSS